MEDRILSQDSVKSCEILIKEDEREKVKDFVYRHFREVTDGSVLMEHVSVQKDRAVLNKGHCRVQQGAVFSGKILSFGCSVCKDGYTYSPNDLLKHFQAAHQGTLPRYPCDLCGFVTNEFPVLQRHRIEHRNPLVTCELCHDGVQYSLLLLTRHYIMYHSLNGQFTCDWCHFTTVDAGTFVQHIHHHKETSWKCLKCSHMSLNEEEHQKHLKAHSGTFPFTCQICGYGTARNEYLKKHIAAVHKSEKRSVWTAIEDNGTTVNSSASLKLLLKKTAPPSGESLEDHRIAKLNIVSENIPNQNGRLVKSDVTDDTVARRGNQEQSAAEILQEGECSPGSDSSQISLNGLTVLRVKNKLSLPPNCTTKVIGFKMVDGKKHLVLKVIQASKQENSEDVGSSAHQFDKRECSNGRNLTPGCLQTEDVMTVKVKVEEEETSVSNLDSNPNETAVAELSKLLPCSSFPEKHPMTYSCDHVTSLCKRTDCCDRTVKDSYSVTAQSSDATNPIVSLAPQSNIALVKNCETADAVLSHTLETEHTSQETTASEIKYRNEQQNIQNMTNAAPASSKRASENCTQNLLTQEVFTFHNYSKETSSSPDSRHNYQNSSDFLEEREAESPHFSLILAESPDPVKVREEPTADVSQCSLGDRVSSDDVEVDECIADVEEEKEEENPDSVLQDFNIIKIEEDNIPVSKPPPDHPTLAAADFVEEHSDAIMHQQLTKEITASAGCSDNTDPTNQTKATLRVLQLPEGKQPVLLRTTENRLAMPVQVKAAPGFKLITNSTNPQINVTYMKPASERTANPGFVLGTNSRRIGVPAGKSAALLPVPKQGITTSLNHYLITSDMKQPLLIPRTPNSTPTDKSTKTCYVLQRSLPVVQTPTASGLSLASTQLSLSTQSLLAMPVNSAESAANQQSGRQTFLLRYVSPSSKTTIPISKQETKVVTKSLAPCTQPNECLGNKVIFKIVTPSSNHLSNASPVSHSQPVLLTARPKTQCFLVSPNKASLSAGIKQFIAVQSSSQKVVTEASVLHSPVKVQVSEADKPILAPRPIRPPSQRKRRRKQLFEEPPSSGHKSRKLSNKTLPEKEPVVLWSPAPKDMEKTLRLSPLSFEQHIKCPRLYQPVVVLNHPDVDIPEVASIMKVVQRHRGAVTKVALSQKTIQALTDLPACDASSKEMSQNGYTRPRTVQSLVKERYLLKLKLRKKSKKKYRVVSTVPDFQQSVGFTCWFCGRLFDNQEAWIGHGQRHLMEATRDWNTLV